MCATRINDIFTKRGGSATLLQFTLAFSGAGDQNAIAREMSAIPAPNYRKNRLKIEAKGKILLSFRANNDIRK